MELSTFGPNISTNKQKLQRIQDILALSLGAAAGIIGLESMWGFLFYILGITLGNIFFFLICSGTSSESYFQSPFKEVLLDGMLSSISGFVMVWCLVYALVK